MFRLQPKVKERRKVPIPSDLREAMREVFSLIKEAKRDPDVALDFDDAIQVGSLCGGRYQKKPNRYEFRYYPENNRQLGTWYLDLANCDIEDIADGRLTEITLHCCPVPECGRKFSKASGHCSCDYVKDPDFGVFDFPEASEKLRQRSVNGLSESSTLDDVLAVLGPPHKTGGNVTTSFGCYIRPWIKYWRDDCQLRFEFDQQRIKRISIMEKDWEPGETPASADRMPLKGKGN